jgi:hypothetical protein
MPETAIPMELLRTSDKIQKASKHQHSHNELETDGLKTITNPAPDGEYDIKVYVDDYILGVLEDRNLTLVKRVAGAALYGIHSVFPPPRITGHEGGKDPISEKKLSKGDAKFQEGKIILGFLFNGTYRTVQLPTEKADRIITEIQQQLKKTGFR